MIRAPTDEEEIVWDRLVNGITVATQEDEMVHLLAESIHKEIDKMILENILKMSES